MANNHKQAWEHYWKHGNQAGCIQQSDEGYRQEIIDCWKNAFLQFKPEKLVDLCTGSGAVLKIAAEVSSDSQLIGIDSAFINFNPEEWPKGTSFFTETDIHALPLADNSVDFISSQYGLEYCDFTVAVPEIGRVTTPGGKVMFVMHETDGLTVNSAKSSLQFIRFIEQQTLFFPSLKNYINAICQHRNGGAYSQKEPALVKAETKWKAATKKLAKGLKKADSYDITHNLLSVTEHMLLNQKYFQQQDMLTKVDELQEFVAMHKSRLLMCTQAAMTKPRLEALRSLMQQHKFECIQQATVKDEQGRNIALQLVFQQAGN